MCMLKYYICFYLWFPELVKAWSGIQLLLLDVTQLCQRNSGKLEESDRQVSRICPFCFCPVAPSLSDHATFSNKWHTKLSIQEKKKQFGPNNVPDHPLHLDIVWRKWLCLCLCSVLPGLACGHWGEVSNVIMVDEKFTSFHQYLRCRHKSVTIVFSIPGAAVWVWSHIASLVSARLRLFEHAIYSWDGLHCLQTISRISQLLGKWG